MFYSTEKVNIITPIETLQFIAAISGHITVKRKYAFAFYRNVSVIDQTNITLGEWLLHICQRVLILTSEESESSWIGAFEWIIPPLTMFDLLVCCFLLTCWPLCKVTSTAISPSLQKHWNMCSNHCCHILNTSTH